MFQFILSDILIYCICFFVYIGKVVLHVVTLPALFPLKGTDHGLGHVHGIGGWWRIHSDVAFLAVRRKMVRRNTGRSGGFMRDIKPIT